MMSEKQRPQPDLERWSDPVESASDSNSLEITRTFFLSISAPHISIEARGGNFNGVIKHTIEKSSSDVQPTSPRTSYSSTSSTSPKEDRSLSQEIKVQPTSPRTSYSSTSPKAGCSQEIKALITIKYLKGDEKSAREISVVHEGTNSKTSQRIIVSRKSSILNAFNWKRPPFVEVLILYPIVSCLGNESVATRSANLPVVIEDLSPLFFTEFIVESVNGSIDIQSATANALLFISSTNAPIRSSGVLRAPKITLSTVNNPIQVSSLISPEYVSLKSVNGPIHVASNLRSSTLAVENINGPISLNSAVASLKINISSHNQIEVKHAKSNLIHVETQHGKIEGSFKVDGEIKLNSKVGTIDANVQVLKPGKGNQVFSKVSSTVGKINVKYHSHPEEVGLISSIKSEIGSINVIHEGGLNGRLKIESKTGQVEIEKENELENKRVEKRSVGRRLEGELRRSVEGETSQSEAFSSLGDIRVGF